jgi:HEAT repeat protein
MQSGPESLLRVTALSLAAIADFAAQSVGPAAAVSRLVREHARPALRDKIARAMSLADQPETIALGRLLIWLGNEDSIDDFVRLLSGDEDVSALAVEGLTQLSALGDARVLAALESGSSDLRTRLLPAVLGLDAASRATIACLDDEQATVRTLACHALARGRDTSAIPRLFQLLTDSDLGVVHAAVGAIQSLGSAETERLALLALKSENVAERRAALRIITYFGYDGSFELCVQALGSSDERLRDIALAGLPALDDPRVSPTLIAAARHVSGRTRAAALRALGHVRLSPEVEDVVRVAMADPDAWVRYYACQSLGRLRIESALPLLVERLDDTAGHVKVAAVEALAALRGEAALEALAAAARSSDLDVQRAALVGLGERAAPPLRPLLTAALDSQDSSIRLVAVSSLARFEGAETELSETAAKDTDAAVRSAAIELLASRTDVAATEALLALLARDPDSASAAAALARHAEARIPSISSLLEHANDALARALLAVISRAETPAGRAALDAAFASRNVAARRAAARALSVLLDEAAKSSLARAATVDPDAEVRRICAAAVA